MEAVFIDDDEKAWDNIHKCIKASIEIDARSPIFTSLASVHPDIRLPGDVMIWYNKLSSDEKEKVLQFKHERISKYQSLEESLRVLNEEYPADDLTKPMGEFLIKSNPLFDEVKVLRTETIAFLSTVMDGSRVVFDSFFETNLQELELVD